MIIHALAYFVILAILFVFNFVNTSYAPFLLDIVFGVLTIIGLVTVVIHCNFVKVTFEHKDLTGERTQKQLIRCRVENKSFIPITRCKIYFTAVHKGSNRKKKYKQNVFCGGLSTAFAEFYLDCPNCEIIDIKINKIYVYDFTGLFCLRKKAGQTNMVLVMPHLPPIELIDKMAYVINEDEGTIYAENKPGDDPTEIFAIREYVPGDNVRKIHWKLSSKSDKLMVKDFSLPIKNNDMVIIDLFEAVNDQVFDLFYGLVNAMTRRKVGFNVCYYDGKFRMKRIETENDIKVLFSQLYDLKPCVKNGDTAAKLFYGENWGKKHRMFYVTNFLDDSTVSSMQVLSEMGIVFYLIPGHVHNSYMPVRFVW